MGKGGAFFFKRPGELRSSNMHFSAGVFLLLAFSAEIRKGKGKGVW